MAGVGQGFGSKLEASRGVVAGRAGGFGAGGSLCEEPVSLAVRPGKRCRGLAALVLQGVSVIFGGILRLRGLLALSLVM